MGMTGKVSLFRKPQGTGRTSVGSQDPLPLRAGLFSVDTMFHLNNEQRGAYIMLLVHAWSSKQPLPDDDVVLARVCQVSRTVFSNRIRPAITQFFEIADDTWLPCAGHIADPNADRLPWTEWATLRSQVFERDNFTCSYCGQYGGKLECDHVIPIARGGSNDLDNLTTSCHDCNRAKGCRTVEEWRGA